MNSVLERTLQKEAQEELFNAQKRFREEKRNYENAVHNYYKKLREIEMQRFKDNRDFEEYIEKLLYENDAPIDEIKKFNDIEVFDYLITNIDMFYGTHNDKIKNLKIAKPNNILKLSTILTASKNNYIFNRIIENCKKPDYISPIIKPIIKDSYGVIIYEDQVDEIIKLILDTNEYEADMFYESLNNLYRIKGLYQIDTPIMLIDHIKENYCDVYMEQFKTPYYGFVSSAIEKGIKENKAKKLFNLLFAYFTCSGSCYKNTQVHFAKELYAIAYMELKYPNSLLDSIKEK